VIEKLAQRLGVYFLFLRQICQLSQDENRPVRVEAKDSSQLIGYIFYETLPTSRNHPGQSVAGFLVKTHRIASTLLVHPALDAHKLFLLEERCDFLTECREPTLQIL
jgi:hypothetical protein